jgi:uncharacterized membrane protein YfcA
VILELSHAQQVLFPCLLVIASTHWLGAIAAYGSTLLALPFLVLLLDDLPAAVLVLTVIGTFQAFQVCAHTYRDVDRQQLGRMLGWAGGALPLGVLLVQWLPRRPLFLVLGLVLIAAAVSEFISRRNGGAGRLAPPWLRALLFAGGIIHGAFGTGGATLVVYAQQVFTRKEVFRATLSAFWTILNPVLLTTLLFRHSPTPAEAFLIALALPFLFFATWHANRVADRIPQTAFRRLVAVLLLVAGVMTVGRVWHP